MVKAFTLALALLLLTAVASCTRLSPTEAKLVGTWGTNSVSGEINSIYRADHTWISKGAGAIPLKGRWWIEDNELVSYLEPPKEYADWPSFAWLRERKRVKIVQVTAKRLVLSRDGSKWEILRMRCPRCEAELGSFATYKSLPTQRSSCPKCGLRLDEM